MRTSPIALALLLGLAPACLDNLASDEIDLIDGTPEAIGVLRFLNSEAATFEVLDIDAALDVRAARNIVAHVRGGDGALGGGDDDLIDDVAELDAIAYVGPATIQRLVDYVASIGGIPDVELEGVVMTQAELDQIVVVANSASLEQLDVDAALDARAARNIVAARPIADGAALAAVPYVGRSAIEHLLAYAPTWSAPEEPPPPACDASYIARRSDGALDDWNRLMWLGTTYDYPWADTLAMQGTCYDLDDAADRDALVRALVFAPINWSMDEYPGAGPLNPGATRFLALMAETRDVLEERVAEGSWDPANADSDDLALWNARADVYDQITARAIASPESFQEVSLWIDAEECSQLSVALVDVTDLRIWIVHRYPRC